MNPVLVSPGPGLLNASPRRPMLDLDACVAWLYAASLFVAVTPINFNFSARPNASDSEINEGRVIEYSATLLLYLATMLLIWLRRRMFVQTLQQSSWLYLGFVAWSCTTILWSPVPIESAQTLIRLVADFLFVAALVNSNRTAEQNLALLRNTLGFFILLSIFFVIFVPGWGVSKPGTTHAGHWCGITYHKNNLAHIAVYAAILWAHAIVVFPRGKRRWAVLMTLACLVTVMGSRSSTGLLLIFAGVPMVIILSLPIGRLILKSWVGWLSLSALTAVLVWVYVVLAGSPTYAEFLRPIAEAFGKDLTLTGRTGIWAIVLEDAGDYWVHGTGYGGYWSNIAGPSADASAFVGHGLWQAHNGYVDLLNETGVIGLGLIMAAILTHLAWVLRNFGTNSRMPVHLVMIVIILISNISESGLSRPITLGGLITVFLLMARRIERPQHRPVQPRVIGSVSGPAPGGRS